ncbi:hypothetical protein [Streptomyces sp. PSKA30]|uniref:hypothetical protein n=1 Tax=Streptomyces sp. PSKA30 TaxID=2874597 RepID=UPI001CD0EE9B|nr:hypothetical protein [Streptomyces sp. PSKA30]MBZ9638013.1 hypothetical protein [Streptomyces sp. PSKA30]
MAASFASAGVAAGAFKAAVQPQLESVKTAAEEYTKVQEKQAEAERKTADARKLATKGGKEYEQALVDAEAATKAAKDAQSAYDASLKDMPAATRDTAKAFVGLKTDFTAWSDSLAGTTMPVFTRGIEILRDALPSLTPLVKTAAGEFKRFLDNLGSGTGGKVFGEFGDNMRQLAGPSLRSFLNTAKNIGIGFAGILNAFAPMSRDVTSGIEGLSAKFAEFGANLKGSDGFQQFMTYVRENGPIVANLIGNFATTAGHLLVALAPLGGATLLLVDGFASLVSAIPTPVLSIFATVVAGIVVGLKAYALAMGVVRAVTTAWATAQAILNGTLVISPIGIVIAAVVALGAVFYLAWRRSETFRNIVKAAWEGIQAAASYAWNSIIKPAFNGLVSGLKSVGGWFKWLNEKVVQPVWQGIRSAISFAWNNGIKPAFGFLKDGVSGVGSIFRWLRDKVVRPIWDGIKSAISTVWEKGIKPVFGTLKAGVKAISDSFDAARKAIKIAWDKLKSITKAPVQFIVDIVYNKGIRGVWNKIATAFGAPKLDKFAFARGGILPGYTPGRDPHKFYSPSGMALEMSGGEAIMRPEFTRGAGSGFVNYFNRLAKSSGAAGVRRALAPVLGGDPRTGTDRSLRYAGGGITQRFADGGIFGWIKSAASAAVGAGSKAWNAIKKGASWLTDTLEASARAGVKNVVDPLLRNFPGADTGIGKMLRRIPTRIIDALFGYSKKADGKGAGGIGGPRIQAALKWAKTQNGKAYQWGGNGNPSWDCSGFMSAIESVIRGQKPHRRWSTHAFKGGTPPGWVRNGASAFRVGITHAGVGHTAGTVGKTDVESRGGDGVVVGRRARGYRDRLFTSWYGFQPGKYDAGGWLGPGQVGVNQLKQPEAVLTPGQWRTMAGLAAAGGNLDGMTVNVWVGNEQITDIARAEVRDSQQRLIQVINAS